MDRQQSVSGARCEANIWKQAPVARSSAAGVNGGMRLARGLCRFVWHWPPAVAAGRGARQPGAAVLPALRARSRAGEARRSVPLRASETPIRSRASGWLRLFSASARARPAARTSPPLGAGLGVGAPAGLGRGIRPTEVGSTRNDLNPLRVSCGRYCQRSTGFAEKVVAGDSGWPLAEKCYSPFRPKADLHLLGGATATY